MLNKRQLLINKIKSDVDIERLAELLANDFMLQDAAGDLEKTIEQVEEIKE